MYVCVCGASYCMVDPAVGDLWSSSVSENAILHALYTRVLPQVAKGWLVLFHLCMQNKRKKKNPNYN